MLDIRAILWLENYLQVYTVYNDNVYLVMHNDTVNNVKRREDLMGRTRVCLSCVMSTTQNHCSYRWSQIELFLCVCVQMLWNFTQFWDSNRIIVIMCAGSNAIITLNSIPKGWSLQLL